jgi:hypothetical protein
MVSALSKSRSAAGVVPAARAIAKTAINEIHVHFFVFIGWPPFVLWVGIIIFDQSVDRRNFLFFSPPLWLLFQNHLAAHIPMAGMPADCFTFHSHNGIRESSLHSL